MYKALGIEKYICLFSERHLLLEVAYVVTVCVDFFHFARFVFGWFVKCFMSVLRVLCTRKVLCMVDNNRVLKLNVRLSYEHLKCMDRDLVEKYVSKFFQSVFSFFFTWY